MEQQPRPVHLDKFKEFARSIMSMVESLSIERQYLMAVVLEKCGYTEKQLMDDLAKAKSTPGYQQAARQQFADAWRILNELGTEAVFEAHLLDIPLTDKPN